MVREAGKERVQIVLTEAKKKKLCNLIGSSSSEGKNSKKDIIWCLFSCKIIYEIKIKERII